MSDKKTYKNDADFYADLDPLASPHRPPAIEAPDAGVEQIDFDDLDSILSDEDAAAPERKPWRQRADMAMALTVGLVSIGGFVVATIMWLSKAVWLANVEIDIGTQRILVADLQWADAGIVALLMALPFAAIWFGHANRETLVFRRLKAAGGITLAVGAIIISSVMLLMFVSMPSVPGWVMGLPFVLLVTVTIGIIACSVVLVRRAYQTR